MTLAAIFGVAGTALDAGEAAFFRRVQPWGFILFARNIASPDQTRRLVDSLRETVGRVDAPVLIDQEGGRVQRLRPPHWPIYPPAATYGRVSPDSAAPRELARLGARLIAHDLAALGINVDCAPVADVPAPGAHRVIGDRAYGGDAETVADLARAAAEGFLAGGVLPVVKHIPGHGRARADSHEALPVVDTGVADLAASDFFAFRRLADLPIAMTAHVVFAAIDPEQPATTSRKVIAKIIRGDIGFSGLLVSDDLSMKALSGDLADRARAALAAGCDIALHCNGELQEMEAVAAGSLPLRGPAANRAASALARIAGPPESFDPVAGRARLDAALAGASVA